MIWKEEVFYMKETLQKILKRKELIATYTLPEKQNSFEVGFLIEMDEDNIILEGYTVDGHFDGYLMICINDIYRIEQDSKYLKALDRLLDTDHKEECILRLSNHCFNDMINYAQSYNRILSICYMQRDGILLTGYVQEINDDTIKLQQINEYGEQDGTTVIYKNDCCFLSCGGQDERRIEMLYNHSKPQH